MPWLMHVRLVRKPLEEASGVPTCKDDPLYQRRAGLNKGVVGSSVDLVPGLHLAGAMEEAMTHLNLRLKTSWHSQNFPSFPVIPCAR